VFLIVSAFAHAHTWSVDPSHSRVGFAVSHLTVSTVRGEFGEFSGTVEYDPARVADTRVSGTVTVASIATRDARRDDHLRSADFFDAANRPQMTFTSKAVKNAGKDGLDLVGDLTIRGTTKEVILHLDPFTAEVKDPWGNLRVGTHATGRINRQDFGINFSKLLDNGGRVVGDEVAIELDVELKRPAQ
jgi:polyisoprenoid-binding protein YceI